MNTIADNLTLAGDKLSNAGEQFRKIPGVFSYYKNGEEQDINNIPVLYENNFKFYVGQTLKFTVDQFYSENFYVGSIQNLLENSSKDSVINIEVGAELKQILDSEGDNSELRMSVEEQIEFINYIINKYFKKDKKRFKVTNLSDNHKELFDKLQNDGVKGTLDNNKLLIGNFTSLDIYNLLYEATIFDSKFFNRIQKTRPTREKDRDDENGKYYPLAEIAFRLTDYINGVYIQGGERRQNVYDVIIRDIISGGYNHIEGIKQLHDIIISCDNDFESIHFNKKKYEKEENRKEGVKKIKNYVGGVSLAISLIVGTAVGTVMHKNNQKEKELQGKIDIAIVELSKKMPEFRDFTDNFMRIEGGLVYESLNFSKYNSEELAKRFVNVYGEGDEDGYQFIQLLILQTMKNSQEFFDKQYYLMPDYWFNEFIKDKFIEDNKAILLLKGYSIDKELGEFTEYKSIMEDTVNLTDEELEKIKFGSGLDTYETPFITNLINNKTEYRGYYTNYIIGYIKCNQAIVNPGAGVSIYTTCGGREVTDMFLVGARKSDNKYSLKLGKKISKELLDLL